MLFFTIFSKAINITIIRNIFLIFIQKSIDLNLTNNDLISDLIQNKEESCFFTWY